MHNKEQGSDDDEDYDSQEEDDYEGDEMVSFVFQCDWQIVLTLHRTL